MHPEISKSNAATLCKRKPRPWYSHFSAFWQFCRPHTIVGTSLSVWGLYLIAIALENSPSVTDLGLAWVACLCGNIYIVGLNQLEDIAIDHINKPHLPLPAKQFSRWQATVIVGITGSLAIVLAALGSWALLGVVGLSLLIGTAYSLPPIRLKRFPLPAAICILTVRGMIVNLGLYLHFGSLPFPPLIWVLTLFVVGFTVAIALYKDIPDIEGDRHYHIRTFTLELGQRAVFWLAIGILMICYVGVIAVALLGLRDVHGGFLIASHLAAMALLGWRCQAIDLSSKSAISRSYQFIWKLFYLEYCLFPLACWLEKG